MTGRDSPVAAKLAFARRGSLLNIGHGRGNAQVVAIGSSAALTSIDVTCLSAGRNSRVRVFNALAKPMLIAGGCWLLPAREPPMMGLPA